MLSRSLFPLCLSPQRALLRKYERELKRLRSELEARSKNVVDKRKLIELEEQRKRAEQDKVRSAQRRRCTLVFASASVH